ncbi:unnamed protein product [Symbiodinium natans]|uniref:Phospholipase/carboxylesterase/thioesterase domain-containing protein n=1 Tax=Symbiodinium natans TaxID=878477 RepID=A0A812JRK3_9DINO|nr:unnamed protein product [Symbiodinium natans]
MNAVNSLFGVELFLALAAFRKYQQSTRPSYNTIALSTGDGSEVAAALRPVRNSLPLTPHLRKFHVLSAESSHEIQQEMWNDVMVAVWRKQCRNSAGNLLTCTYPQQGEFWIVVGPAWESEGTTRLHSEYTGIYVSKHNVAVARKARYEDYKCYWPTGSRIDRLAGLLGVVAACRRFQGRRHDVSRGAEEEPPRWDPTAPVWTAEDLEDTSAGPSDSCPHTHTLVYLHAFGRCGKEYVQPLLDRLSPGFSIPWTAGPARAGGLRVALPTAPKGSSPTRHPRSGEGQGDSQFSISVSPVETSWHEPGARTSLQCSVGTYKRYASADSNEVGDAALLAEQRRRLAKLLEEEVDRLGGRGERVFLGGLSQGCTAALDIYLQEACRLRLGGFVGSVGFLPSDEMGFPGADEALDALLADKDQAARPVVLQSAEDDEWVPWEELVKPSLERIFGRWPGFKLRSVRGRGHVVEQWEGDLLNEFMKEHAVEAYNA